jgi:hypothetical protein
MSMGTSYELDAFVWAAPAAEMPGPPTQVISMPIATANADRTGPILGIALGLRLPSTGPFDIAISPVKKQRSWPVP